MKRILLPTDFSPQAENALKVAVQMAKKNDSEIYLLHSMEMPLHLANTNKGALPEALFFIKLAEKQFAELMKKPYLKKVKVKQTIGHGEIYDDISEAVKSNKIDLIVMGSHGASGFKEMFIGSNTEKVVRTSKIPVLVIKNEHKKFEVKDFVFATDFSNECKKPFEVAQKFAENFGATIHLLYVNTPSGFTTSMDAKKMMALFIKGMKYPNYTLNIYNDISVEKGILGFARESNAQLIGMSTHGRKGISHFFNGSVSEDLVNHANMPVMTFKI
ncbi:MAG TPA: universal stress protein UspA [Flavobacteriaceae bacterium]|nr:universal stress protein UspA [Flavobacteriaceae bacterium]HAT63021.1 universal stress protein UspA [Flavobacteriaceae bacterium]|tara:strand:+ start:52442 stop:53260 length:819 start_codon:yes stop_codon:yes gene_type:complete